MKSNNKYLLSSNENPLAVLDSLSEAMDKAQEEIQAKSHLTIECRAGQNIQIKSWYYNYEVNDWVVQ